MSPVRALIDGDVLVYRTGFAGQQTLVSAVRGTEVLVQDAQNLTECKKQLQVLGIPEEDVQFRKEVIVDSIGNVFHSLDMQVQRILESVQAGASTVFLTGKGNFRESIAKSLPYKGNRLAEKPVYYQEIRARLEKKYSAQVITGAEADDALAISMTAAAYPSEVVCCSIDKDLKQVPGWHYSWIKDDVVWVPYDQGVKSLFQQVLTGDSTDNIRGIPGVGPKTAAKCLEGCLTWPEHCEKALEVYLQHGLTEEDFIECFNLVYLCRTQEELLSAQQAAAKGSPGISPWTAEGAKEYLPPVSEEDHSSGSYA